MIDRTGSQIGPEWAYAVSRDSRVFIFEQSGEFRFIEEKAAFALLVGAFPSPAGPRPAERRSQPPVRSR